MNCLKCGSDIGNALGLCEQCKAQTKSGARTQNTSIGNSELTGMHGDDHRTRYNRPQRSSIFDSLSEVIAGSRSVIMLIGGLLVLIVLFFGVRGTFQQIKEDAKQAKEDDKQRMAKLPDDKLIDECKRRIADIRCFNSQAACAKNPPKQLASCDAHLQYIRALLMEDPTAKEPAWGDPITFRAETIQEQDQRQNRGKPTPYYQVVCPNGKRTTKPECCNDMTGPNGITILREGCFYG